MALLGEKILLRVFTSSAERAGTGPLYERIVREARRGGLAGATVLKGVLGFGHHGVLPPAGWHYITPVPVIVEMADGAERVAGFLQGTLRPMMRRGMITLERAGVMMYRRRGDEGSGRLALLAGVAPLSTVPGIEDGGAAMESQMDGVLLRIFIGESDSFEGRPLYERIVAEARRQGLAGATVLRGAMGYGANSVLHTTKLVEYSTDLPIVIEIVDSEEKVAGLLPGLEVMVKEGMITMEHVRVLMWRHNPGDG